MTRFIYDQFSKDYLEILLNPSGNVEVAKQLAGEIREIDLYFSPNSPNLPSTLGILARLAATDCLLEPYRNPVSTKEIKDCLLKLLQITAYKQREATRNNRSLSTQDSPRLWIITPTASREKLEQFGAKLQPDWVEGIYFLPESLRTAIVVVHQLPVTPDTLWLRLLGRGKVQRQGIDELVNLPPEYPYKSGILEVLYTLQKNLEINQKDGEDQELIMRLAPLYQEDRARAIQEGFELGKAEGEAKGKINLILRLLTRRFGDLDPEITNSIARLTPEKLESLEEMLLDFNTVSDLNEWLSDNSQKTDPS
ncbi:DUF4351 domain-containing protein [Gloeocapsa sp. PCC 73106]|uniref:DUF4351 domain-containing protein n=1 Tax=Gloeocapsa sp. PCC 73106 TaxID=102232 RepID=UPI0002AC249B|nr:DUF4351 domain-containing protein [Gloeocapsa sp. PCC 73106]ELS00106.1 hypothetical protein GLO73106DRAFT_00039610 [Gloeocapsa sp. PCC 73106]